VYDLSAEPGQESLRSSPHRSWHFAWLETKMSLALHLQGTIIRTVSRASQRNAADPPAGRRAALRRTPVTGSLASARHRPPSLKCEGACFPSRSTISPNTLLAALHSLCARLPTLLQGYLDTVLLRARQPAIAQRNAHCVATAGGVVRKLEHRNSQAGAAAFSWPG
jgi:hypothetical protein